MNYIECAKAVGFSDAAIMKVSDLVVVPEYRKFCEDNLCGNYNKLKQCPPESGTVEEMTASIKAYETALILTTIVPMKDINDMQEHMNAKKKHNMLADTLLSNLTSDGLTDYLVMSAGPWKHNSCMSAYSVDAQKMADSVGMKCWENDGKARYFSLILF